MYKYQILMADTDGIAQGLCSKSGKNNKQQVIDKVKELELKWQKALNFPEFELDIEEFDFVVEIGHKNYVYGKLDSVETIETKGNNFKSKNKSKIGYKVLKQVIFDSIKNIGDWQLEDKEKIRAQIKNNIIDNTNIAIKNIDMSTVNMDDIILYENVNPFHSYKKPDSIHATRCKAIEKLTGIKISYSSRFPMLVCKEHLPGLEVVSPKKTKAIHYMWPTDYVTNGMIDLDWYKENVRSYIFGAFGITKKKSKNSKKKELDINQCVLEDF